MKKGAIYNNIAYAIATEIAQGNLKENERFSGRSLISSKYSVSPETIRKALVILKDEDIIEVVPQAGNFVKSRLKAVTFLQKNEKEQELNKLEESYLALNEEKKRIENELDEVMRKIIAFKNHDKELLPIKPSEFTIEKGSLADGKTIGELDFRNLTNSTIIAINNNEELIKTPNATTKLSSGMILTVITNLSDMHKILALVSFKE